MIRSTLLSSKVVLANTTKLCRRPILHPLVLPPPHRSGVTNYYSVSSVTDRVIGGSRRRRSISSSSLSITPHSPTSLSTLITTHRPPNPTHLKFGQTLLIPYDENKCGGWQAPSIVPYGNLQISPAASALHYGLECFEGMKAYRALSSSSNADNNHQWVVVDGEEEDVDLRLFRPHKNMERLRNSMDRLGMPGTNFESNEVIHCIKELVRLDKDWIPPGIGYSLYLRPTVISTHPYLGLTTPDSLLLYVISCPVGPYYASGLFTPIKLTTDTPYVRAWPGGAGASKIGGNYGPTMMPGQQAQEHGYSQILWLYGPEEYVTEVGAMNVFFLFEKSSNDGKKKRSYELVTPPLTNGDILPGVTRQSILELTSTWKNDEEYYDMDVVERSLSMSEIKQSAIDGRLIEAFGTGTAAVVTPISHIQYRGEDIVIPAPGTLTQRLYNDLVDIQYGIVDGPEGWSVRV